MYDLASRLEVLAFAGAAIFFVWLLFRGWNRTPETYEEQIEAEINQICG